MLLEWNLNSLWTVEISNHFRQILESSTPVSFQPLSVLTRLFLELCTTKFMDIHSSVQDLAYYTVTKTAHNWSREETDHHCLHFRISNRTVWKHEVAMLRQLDLLPTRMKESIFLKKKTSPYRFITSMLISTCLYIKLADVWMTYLWCHCKLKCSDTHYCRPRKFHC